MEITSFILGVCTVIVLVMVVGTFVNYMSTKSLKEEINQLNRVIELLTFKHQFFLYTEFFLQKAISQYFP